MESFSIVKVIAAFIAGVVIALGGVLMYVRTNEMIHPHLQAHSTGSSADSTLTGQDAADANTQTPPVSPEDIPELKPVPKFQPKAHAVPTKPAAKPVQTPEAPRMIKPKGTWHSAQDLHQVKGAGPAHSPAKPLIVAKNIAPPKPERPAASAADESAVGSDNQTTAPPDNPESAAAPETAPTPVSQDNSQAAAPEPAPVPAENPPAPPQPHTVSLPAGTNLVVRLAETVSTEDNYTGDTFRAHLEEPIIMDGFVIADKGSKVLGRIVNAQKGGYMDTPSELTLTVTEINTTDGQRVNVPTTTWDKKGVRSTGEDAAKIAGGAALGAIIGGAAGGGKGAAIGVGAGAAAGTGAVVASHGKPTRLPVETRLVFRLAKPVTITEKLNF